MTLTIEFTFPAQHLSMNDRMHWRDAKRLRDAWFDKCLLVARAAGWRDLPPSNVQVTYTGIMVSDPENLAPTTKSLIDALATGRNPKRQGAGLWPDDDDRYVTVLPNIVVRGRKPLSMRTVSIAITDRGAS